MQMVLPASPTARANLSLTRFATINQTQLPINAASTQPESSHANNASVNFLDFAVTSPWGT